MLALCCNMYIYIYRCCNDFAADALWLESLCALALQVSALLPWSQVGHRNVRARKPMAGALVPRTAAEESEHLDLALRLSLLTLREERGDQSVKAGSESVGDSKPSRGERPEGFPEPDIEPEGWELVTGAAIPVSSSGIVYPNSVHGACLPRATEWPPPEEASAASLFNSVPMTSPTRSLAEAPGHAPSAAAPPPATEPSGSGGAAISDRKVAYAVWHVPGAPAARGVWLGRRAYGELQRLHFPRRADGSIIDYEYKRGFRLRGYFTKQEAFSAYAAEAVAHGCPVPPVVFRV